MKRTAILIPTYKRFADLINTLEKTKIDDRAKFVIVANLEDGELNYIREKYGDKAIIADEREYGKLGGCKAYNLAFKIAKENHFDYAILFADDIIPFKPDWLNQLYHEFIDTNGKFGIFSTDECHPGYYGYNIILDCPIAHFFIIDCNLVEQLFSEKYKQYVIDFEIAVRLKERGVDIQLLPVKLNHLRSGLHRELMGNHYNVDRDKFLLDYPQYDSSFKQSRSLFFVKHSHKSNFISKINIDKLPQWSDLKPKEKLIDQIKRQTKSTIKDILNSTGYSIHKKTVEELNQKKKYALFKNQLNEFKNKIGDSINISENPCLFDDTTITPIEPHYTYHPPWAARVLAQINPVKHIDISSTTHFGTIVSAFIPIEFYDYRPADIHLSNYISGKADLTNLHFASNSIESLSCMHTVEHIGLGRYGDPMDVEGDMKAMKELERVLAINGNLLFVVPIGFARIEFNAHRVYAYDTIISAFSGLSLKEFTLIPDDFKEKGYITNPPIELVDNQNWGCGCFWFTKTAI